MEESVSSNVLDTINGKENEPKKERPTSLDLESCNFGNDGEQTPDDTRQTTRWLDKINFQLLWIEQRLVQMHLLLFCMSELSCNLCGFWFVAIEKRKSFPPHKKICCLHATVTSKGELFTRFLWAYNSCSLSWNFEKSYLLKCIYID